MCFVFHLYVDLEKLYKGSGPKATCHQLDSMDKTRMVSRYKLFTLVLCPATLLVGHLLSYWFPSDLQFRINKDSWVNVFFVKRGWFWSSAVGWWCTIRYGSLNRRNRHSVVRYAILTVWWYMFTQSVWFGSAPIMDIIFTLTGGSCRFNVFDEGGKLSAVFHDSLPRRLRSLQRIYYLLKKKPGDDNLLTQSLNSIRCVMNETDCHRDLAKAVQPADLNHYIRDSLCSGITRNSSAVCRALGGYWVGGHDPSGHIFLITLMIMYLLGELHIFGKRALSKVLKEKKRFWKPFYNLFDNGALWNVLESRPKDFSQLLLMTVVEPAWTFAKNFSVFSLQILNFVVLENPVILLIGLLLMWWWSFLVTSIVFHTLLEQVSGLAFAYLVAGVIYWNDHWFIRNAMH